MSVLSVLFQDREHEFGSRWLFPDQEANFMCTFHSCLLFDDSGATRLVNFIKLWHFEDTISTPWPSLNSGKTYFWNSKKDTCVYVHCQYTYESWHDVTHSKNTWWGSITLASSHFHLLIAVCPCMWRLPSLSLSSLTSSFPNHCLSLTKFFQVPLLRLPASQPLHTLIPLSPSPLHLADAYVSLESRTKCLSWSRCLWLLDELTSHVSHVSGAPCLSPIMTQVSII